MNIDIRSNKPEKVSSITYADDAVVGLVYEDNVLIIGDSDEAEVSVFIGDVDNLIVALQRAKELMECSD